MNFADELQASISRRKSFIVCGFDPRIEKIPNCFKDAAAKKSSSSDDEIYHLLYDFHSFALDALSEGIAAIKPNIAFFERHGIPALRALQDILVLAREKSLPIVLDAKRGDIGSTAEAYSDAFLKRGAPFEASALTVSPYLGFDTIESYFQHCSDFGKGLFVLVKTSNPGSGDLQDRRTEGDHTVSERVAEWLASQSEKFLGKSGYSSLGAVIGATYPEEAKRMRSLMPNNLFLIPGLGAQGGTAEEAVSGFGDCNGQKGGAIINVSRGLLGAFSDTSISLEQARAEIESKLTGFNQSVNKALEAST